MNLDFLIPYGPELRVTHRIFAFLFLAGVTAVISLALYRRVSGKKLAEKGMATLAKVSVILGHTQLLLGLILYFVLPWFELLTDPEVEVMANATIRFFAVEHISVNILGIALLTVGHSKFKKNPDSEGKDKAVLIYYGLGLLLILSRIPWDRLFSEIAL